MAKSCCGRPIAKIIKVGTFDAGVSGLEAVLKNVYSSGVKDEEQIKTELLRLLKDCGNYIYPELSLITKTHYFKNLKSILLNECDARNNSVSLT